MSRSETPSPSRLVLRVADLKASEDRAVRIEPDAAARAEIAAELGLIGLRKLRFEGRLMPVGQRDWRLTAHIGATVVQPCIVTLAPVTTRIDDEVVRTWCADMAEPEGDEVELPEDVDQEPLGAQIDLSQVMIEALALALPLYPRAADADLGESAFTEPGKVAMTDEDARPFAGLAALVGKTGNNDGTDES